MLRTIIQAIAMLCVIASPAAAQSTAEFLSINGLPAPVPVSTTAVTLGDQAFLPPAYANAIIGTGGPGGAAIRGAGFVDVKFEVSYPSALNAGPYPLVIFLHGMHYSCYPPGQRAWPCETRPAEVPNHLGYTRSARQLASHGFIVASISANGVNAYDNMQGNPSIGMQARAELVQYHLGIWRDLNAGIDRGTGLGRLFAGRVDLTQIGTMGHSRGGEGVVQHYHHNLQNGNVFPVRATLLLAPTRFSASAQRRLIGVASEVVLPYCDGDVRSLDGIGYFDASRYDYGVDTTPKFYVTMMGANHNFYNTTWTTGMHPTGSDDWGDRSDPFCTGQRLTPDEQVRLLGAYSAAFFSRVLKGNQTATNYLTGMSLLPVGIPADSQREVNRATLLHGYHAPDNRRRDLNRLRTAAEASSVATMGGRVFPAGLSVNQVCRDAPVIAPVSCASSPYAVQKPHAVPMTRLGTAASPFPALAGLHHDIPQQFRNFREYNYLRLRLSVANQFGGNGSWAARPRFLLMIYDAFGKTQVVDLTSVNRSVFTQPGKLTPGPFATTPKLLLNGAVLPLAYFNQVDLGNVTRVALLIQTGNVPLEFVVSDFQLTSD